MLYIVAMFLCIIIDILQIALTFLTGDQWIFHLRNRFCITVQEELTSDMNPKNFWLTFGVHVTVCPLFLYFISNIRPKWFSTHNQIFSSNLVKRY